MNTIWTQTLTYVYGQRKNTSFLLKDCEISFDSQLLQMNETGSKSTKIEQYLNKKTGLFTRIRADGGVKAFVAVYSLLTYQGTYLGHIGTYLNMT